MRRGILLCGLNGSGKSTLGRVLAAELGLDFFDNEDYYFPNHVPGEPYENPRTKAEVCELLLADLEKSEGFVFASVGGDYGKAIERLFTVAVLLEVPREVRLARVRARSVARYGEPLPEEEERFIAMVSSRSDDHAERRIPSGLAVARADGTLEIAANAHRLAHFVEGDSISPA